MVLQDKKDEIKAPEKVAPTAEQTVHFKHEGEKALEKKEASPEDIMVTAELKRQIEIMSLDPANEKSVEIEKEKIEYLGEAQKIEHLLKLASEKGLVYAIQIAKSMNEPYLLDTLHDTLANKGYYEDFLNKKT